MNKLRLIVLSTFGLEAVIKRELDGLGFKDYRIADGTIEVQYYQYHGHQASR
ncbi:MAG: hypothetical protein HQL20_08885 [Candidatus Omnitrophica bacterium]|nr:hypothetical protein [Candidatus Omnitrophota bacterium]